MSPVILQRSIWMPFKSSFLNDLFNCISNVHWLFWNISHIPLSYPSIHSSVFRLFLHLKDILVVKIKLAEWFHLYMCNLSGTLYVVKQVTVIVGIKPPLAYLITINIFMFSVSCHVHLPYCKHLMTMILCITLMKSVLFGKPWLFIVKALYEHGTEW